MSSSHDKIIPKALRAGDTIALISPSSRLNHIFPQRISKATTALENLGYKVKQIYTHPIASDNTTRLKQRCEEIHSAFSDPSIAAIICTIGGISANELLRHLDYDLISKNPKIFCGYSDISLLHYAFFTKANLCTFYGPAAITQLAEFPEPMGFVRDHFQRVLTGEEVGLIPQSKEWTQERLDWGTAAEFSRPRALVENKGWKWIRGGSCTGRIFGGCLPSIRQLSGTPYDIDYSGKILLLENPEGDGEECPPYPLDVTRSLMVDLVNAGVFDKIVGMVVGRPYRYDEAMTLEFEKMVGEVVEGWEWPVLVGVDVGHTDPILTIPLYALSSLDSEKNEFRVLDQVVIKDT